MRPVVDPFSIAPGLLRAQPGKVAAALGSQLFLVDPAVEEYVEISSTLSSPLGSDDGSWEVRGSCTQAEPELLTTHPATLSILKQP